MPPTKANMMNSELPPFQGPHPPHKTMKDMNPMKSPAARMRAGRAPMLGVVALGAALLMSVPGLQAQVFYSGLRDIPTPANFDGVYLDIDAGTSSTTEVSGWDVNAFYGGYAIANSATFQPARAAAAVDGLVLNLAPGTLVGPGNTYASAAAGSEGHIGAGAGQFVGGTEGYMGFQFNPQGGGGPLYGWMRVVLTVNQSGGWIKDWAYDTTGAPLAVGVTAVPEPSTYGAFAALGLAGFGVWRRVRR